MDCVSISGRQALSKVSRWIAPGTSVEVVGSAGGWSRVQHNGRLGYMYGGYLSRQTSAVANPTISTSNPFSPEATQIPPSNSNAGQSRGLNPADGARRVFATQYQSCHVLGSGRGLGIHNPLDVIRRQSNYPQNACIDKRNAPYRYGWSGEATYNKTRNELNVFKNMDCSGAVSSFLAAAGLKATVNGPINERLSTGSLSQLGNGPKSCFEYPRMTPQQVFQEGDILNVGPGSHVVMVDRVGQDPLGLSKITSPNQCRSLSFKNFNFSFIHSSRNRGVTGVQRAKASTGASGSVTRGVVALAKQMCQKMFQGQSLVPFQEISVSRGKKFQLMRHRGPAVPGCSAPVPSLKGDQCLMQNNCDIRRSTWT